MTEHDFVDFRRRWLAGSILRYHQHTLINQQNVGRHTYGVVQIIRTIHPNCSKELLLKGLDHDVPELASGDIPHPVKKFKDIGKIIQEYEKDFVTETQVSETEFWILKIADIMDLLLYIEYEKLLGNKTLVTMEFVAVRVLESLYPRVPEDVSRNAKVLMYRAHQGLMQQDERTYGVLL